MARFSSPPELGSQKPSDIGPPHPDYLACPGAKYNPLSAFIPSFEAFCVHAFLTTPPERRTFMDA